MSDKDRTQPILKRKAALSPDQIQARLGRMDRIRRSRMARRGRIKMMFDVLDAIAKGSVKDPKRAAAAVITALDQNEIAGRGVGFNVRDEQPGSEIGLGLFIQDARPVKLPVASQPNERTKTKVMPHRAALRGIFRGIENVRSIAHLFENAEKLADRTKIEQSTRIKIEQSALDFLYKKSRCSPLSRAGWEKDVRTAFSIETIMRLIYPGFELGNFEDLIDQKAKIEVFEKLKSSKGTLLLGFHGGFLKMAQMFFKNTFVAPLGNNPLRGRGVAITGREAREELFIALRTLQDGGVVLIYPDGVKSKQFETLNIFGTSVPSGRGAAFLAYTSNCNTAWYTVVRKGDRFIPVVEPGPSRGGGETFNDFTGRLCRFYAERVEATFTGDPRNILFLPRWNRVFNASYARAQAVDS